MLPCGLPLVWTMVLLNQQQKWVIGSLIANETLKFFIICFGDAGLTNLKHLDLFGAKITDYGTDCLKCNFLSCHYLIPVLFQYGLLSFGGEDSVFSPMFLDVIIKVCLL